MKTIILSLFLCLITMVACGLLGGDDEPDIPGKIAFSAKDENGTAQIFTINANGTGLKQLTFWKYDSSMSPAWSPDGSRIAFATNKNATTLGPSLYIMDADGSNKRPLKKLPYESPKALWGDEPDWSPDGTKIAYQYCTNCEAFGSNHEIVVVEVKGVEYDSSQVQVVSNNPASDTYPIWSPDGRRIAFFSDRDYQKADTLKFRRDLYVMNADGSNQNRITNSGFPGFYTWMNTNKLLLTKTDINTKLKDIFAINIETNETIYFKKDLQIKPQLWLFWNSSKNQLFTINKSHNQIPIIFKVYNTNGNLINQHKLTSLMLKSAIDFDLYINEQNN